MPITHALPDLDLLRRTPGRANAQHNLAAKDAHGLGTRPSMAADRRAAQTPPLARRRAPDGALLMNAPVQVTQ